MSKWYKKKVKDFAFTASGGTPSTERKEYWQNGTIPWINSGELSKHDIIKKPTTYITQEALENSSAKLFPVGTVVIALTGATTGMSAILEIETSTNQSITGIFPSKEHDSKFLLYTLHYNIDKILLHNVGSAQPHINKEIVDNLEFNYPIVPEQNVIAKILSTADTVIEKTQTAIAKYKAIKQGMLQDLFTRGIDLNTNKLRPRYQDAPELYKESKSGMIPCEWDEKELGDVGEVRMCRRVFNYETNDQGDIPFYKIGTFGKQPDAFISKELYESYRQQFSFPKKGDILISAAGTIGRTIIYDGTPSYFQDSNIVWIDNNGDLISNEYLYQVFQIVEYKTEGGTIQRLYNSILKSALFPCPSKLEQLLITERLKVIDNKLQTEQTYLQKMQSLKKGLMEDLLSGRKQVKVSNELKEMA